MINHFRLPIRVDDTPRYCRIRLIELPQKASHTIRHCSALSLYADFESITSGQSCFFKPLFSRLRSFKSLFKSVAYQFKTAIMFLVNCKQRIVLRIRFGTESGDCFQICRRLKSEFAHKTWHFASVSLKNGITPPNSPIVRVSFGHRLRFSPTMNR